MLEMQQASKTTTRRKTDPENEINQDKFDADCGYSRYIICLNLSELARISRINGFYLIYKLEISSELS